MYIYIAIVESKYIFYAPVQVTPSSSKGYCLVKMIEKLLAFIKFAKAIISDII